MSGRVGCYHADGGAYWMAVHPTPLGWKYEVCLNDEHLPPGVVKDAVTGWCFGSHARACRIGCRLMARMNRDFKSSVAPHRDATAPASPAVERGAPTPSPGVGAELDPEGDKP